MVTDQKWMTLQQVAEYLQVTDRTIWNWIKTKQLRASKLSRVWRVDRADVDEFVQSRSNK